MLPGDTFGNMSRVGLNVEVNDLKQRKDNYGFLNLPDDTPFPKHITGNW